jgi:hypothetical protein
MGGVQVLALSNLYQLYDRGTETGDVSFAVEQLLPLGSN